MTCAQKKPVGLGVGDLEKNWASYPTPALYVAPHGFALLPVLHGRVAQTVVERYCIGEVRHNPTYLSLSLSCATSVHIPGTKGVTLGGGINQRAAMDGVRREAVCSRTVDTLRGTREETATEAGLLNGGGCPQRFPSNLAGSTASKWENTQKG